MSKIARDNRDVIAICAPVVLELNLIIALENERKESMYKIIFPASMIKFQKYNLLKDLRSPKSYNEAIEPKLCNEGVLSLNKNSFYPVHKP